MGLLDKLREVLTGGGTRRGPGGDRSDSALYYYVRCTKCREVIRVRVDLMNDLAQDYDGDGDQPTGYVANKGVVGKNCFRVINVNLEFDNRRNEVSRSIEGGEFVGADEYDAVHP